MLRPLVHPFSNIQQGLEDVLQLVVETCADCSQPWTLCGLLCVSSGCRAAVLQAGGRCRITTSHFDSLESFESFAVWLPGHYGLVSALHIDFYCCDYIGTSDIPEALALVVQALEQCAAAAAAAPSSSAGGRRWCLRKFSGCNELACPAVLQALQPAGLQELCLEDDFEDTCTVAMWHALGQLSSLTSLTLALPDVADVEPGAFDGLAAALGNLQRLARLSLSNMPDVLDEDVCRHLPASLQSMELDCCGSQHELQLGHLSSVGVLELWGMKEGTMITPQSVLPPHVTSLHLGGIAVETTFLSSKLVQLKFESSARLAMPCWLSVLPGLKCLDMSEAQYTFEEQQQLVVALARYGTELTSLDWGLGAHIAPGPGGQPGLLAAIAQLRQLRRLKIAGSECPNECEFIQLTALTALTALVMFNCPGLHDKAAVALASSLTALQCLYIGMCSITDAVVPAVDRLTGLTTLSLCNADTLIKDRSR